VGGVSRDRAGHQGTHARARALLSNAISFLDELMPLTRAQTLRDNGIKVALVSNFDERLVLLSPSIHMCYI
jgi:hypothetical protein